MSHWRAIVFVVFGVFCVANSQSFNRRCSFEKLRQCKESVDRSIQKRINDMSRTDMVSHCKVIREDFNCLLRETRCLSSEDERRRNGDVLRNGLVYIRDGCDSLGGSWKESTCFIGDGMKTCETTYPVSSGQFSSSNTENCRKFTQFYECVMNAIKNRCRVEDDRFIGQYLVDKAQDLAWNCQDLDSGQAGDRDRDRDRDRESDSGRAYDRYGSRTSQDRDRGDRYRDDYRSPPYRSDSTNPSSDRRGYDDRYGSDRNSGYSNYNYGRGGGSSYTGDVSCCRNERCDRFRMQECRDSLSRTVDDRSSSNFQSQDERKCRKTRNDFNCLLWQTSCLPREERDRASDVFHRARDFISRNCNTFGRWTENSCYKSTEMQNCEKYLSNTRSGANFEACRNYNRFKECMMDELRRRCTKEDELYQGAYLVDKAQEMSWQCGSENSRRDGGDRDRDRDQYYPSNDRRNPYDYNNAASPYGSYEENTHLDDDDEMCASRMQGYKDRCTRDLEEKRRQLIIENDYDVKQRGTCCSAKRYRTCLLDATRTVCQRERRRVADSLMGRYRLDLETDNCRRIYDSDCSAGNTLIASALLTICLLTILLPSRLFMFSPL